MTAPMLTPIEIAIPPGRTLLEILDEAQVPHDLHPHVLVRLNGRVVGDWGHVLTREGDQVALYALPSGSDKNGIIGAIALIAITVAAVYTGGLAYAALAPAYGASTAAAGAALVTAGITMVGTLLLNALIPPPDAPGLGGPGAQSGAAQESAAYAFSGQSNNARIHQRVPRLYGRHRFTPPLAATPRIANVGTTSRITVLYDFGLGNLVLSDMRIGDLPFDTVDPNYKIHRGTRLPNGPDLLGGRVAYDQLDYALEHNKPLVIYTKPGATRCVIDLNFPTGLVRLNRNGERRLHTAGMRIRYRVQGSGSAWEVAPANWYKGALAPKENLFYRGFYNVGKLIGEEDVTDAWIVSIDRKGRGFVSIWRNGREIYSDKLTNYDRVVTRNLNREWRRGVQRASATGPDDVTYVAYELLGGFPAPAATVLLSERTAVAFTVSARLDFTDLDVDVGPSTVFEVEVTRTTPVADLQQANTLRDAVRVGVIRSFVRKRTLNLMKPHTLVEAEYVATDKISGVINNFNAVAHSMLRRFNASGFLVPETLVRTANPALIAIDILTGDAARRPIRADQIDWPSWNRLRLRCAEQVTSEVNGIVRTDDRYQWNGIIDTDLTRREALQAVLSPCRAAITRTLDGKIGVLMDQENDTPRQLITPANSWGFQGARPFAPIPDALRVSFVDEESDWAQAECLIARPGPARNDPPVIEDLTTFGITSYPEAWRYGRYMMAQGILRSERFSVTMDIENLVVQRGDLVLVQHDVPLFGGESFRVTAVNGDRISVGGILGIDRGLYTVRRTDGTLSSGTIVGLIDENTFQASRGADFDVDSLVVLDLGSAPAVPYIVMGVQPGEDLTARLDLVLYDAEVYAEADKIKLPSWDPNFGNDILDASNLRLQWGRNGGVASSWSFTDRIPHLDVRLSWEVAAGLETYGGAIIEIRRGNSAWTPLHTVRNGAVEHRFSVLWSDAEWFSGETAFRVTPYGALGVQGAPILRNAAFAAYAGTPTPPQSMSLDVRSQEITMFWEPSLAPDAARYTIRYSPKVVGATWAQAQHLGRVGWEATEFSAGARTGTYFIAAENVVGRRSTAVAARTTIEVLPDINVVETRNDAPAWAGTLSNFTRGRTDAWSYATVRTRDGSTMGIAVPPDWNNDILLQAGGSLALLTDVSVPASVLVSSDVWEDYSAQDFAIYQFQGFVALGAIYEVRIQSLIEAEGIDSNVYHGSPVTYASRAASPDQDVDAALPWNAWLEYRAIDEISVMADWATLSSIPNLAFGSSQFGPWRRIHVGDATGRIFQFRIVAKAWRDGMLILVHQGAVEIDMPDRTWRASNIPINVTTGNGTIINFDPAFGAPPVLAVTTEGAGQAVGYRATNLTRTSVQILLVDAAGNGVSGQIDLAALGYGRERAAGI